MGCNKVTYVHCQSSRHTATKWQKKALGPQGASAFFEPGRVSWLAFFLSLGAAVAKTLVESVNTTTAIEDLLLAGKERVTV